MQLLIRLLLCFSLTLLFSWQSLYAQVNMSDGSSTTCGTDFFDSGGSGGGGNSYSNNESFVYTFSPAVAGNKIQIDFERFRTRNANDFLEIFDGNGVTGTLLATLSGNLGTGLTGTQVYTSTTIDGSLTFRFTSDNNNTRYGWEAAISCVPPSLNMSNGSTTTCFSEFFDSGGSGGEYNDDENFVHTFNPTSPTDKISVTFTSFDVENQATCNFDRLIIYDGPTTASPVLGTFCGTTLPPTFTSTDASGSLTFEFISDGFVTEAGWEAEISCVSSPCPIVAGTAAISDNTACLGENITLSLTGQNSSSIQWQASTDGGTIFTDIVGATTDTEIVNPTVNTIYRAVVSNITCLPNSSNSNTVSVTMDNCSVIPPTGTTTLTTCNSTLFDSGGDSGNYTDNEDGTITIFPDVVGNFVRLTFTSFNTQATSDRLRVFDGNTIGATQIGDFSGNISPPVLTSTAADGSLTLRFTSNGNTTNTGFEIAISCFNPCPTVGGTATISDASVCSGEAVTLSLTGQNGSSIQWQQSTNGGVTFSDIVGAITDTETVNPAVNTTYRAVVSSVSCASSNSSTVAVTMINNCVTMPVGTSSVTTCDATLFDSGGSLGDYANNGDGTLTIFPSVTGSKVSITFTEFNTENGTDILRIYDGNSTAFPLLVSASGTALPITVTSTAIDGSLTLDFNANGSIVRPGWRAIVSCTCGWAFNNFTVNNCAGSNPTIYDLTIGFSAISATPNYEVYINGALQTTQAYGTNPQTVTLTGLLNANSPLEIELRNAADPTCNLTRTLFSAGTDRTICGTEVTLNAQTSTGGQWTVVSGPNTPTFSNDLNPNAVVTGMVTGTYTFRWTSTVSGGCSFTDEVTMTMDDDCQFDTSDPNVGNNCGGTFTSHDTYPANYPNNYDEVITLCPEAGQALQLTFDNIDLGTGDNIEIWLSDTQAGAADLTFDDGDNGRSFTVKSQDASGCITVRFDANGSNTGDGFTSTISCTTPDDPAAVDCIGAVPLCTDLTYAFPTGGGGAGTQNGTINNGCAAYNNVKWFYLEIAATGDFEFDINPVVPNDDYDFAIWGPFASYGDIPCLAGDNAGMGAPIRCNYSATRGVTGLSTLGDNDSEGAGGQVYSNELPVIIGEFYVMMVDDFGDQGNGFNITANTINGNNPTNCEIVDCDAFFGNQVFSSTGTTNFGNNYICYNDAITLGAVDNSYTFGGLTGEELYFVHSDNPNTPFNIRNNFTLDNLATSDYVTTNLGGVDNNQLTFTNDGSMFADNQIWNIYATTGVAGAPDPSFVNSCSFWFPFEVKLLPEITATLPTGCAADFSITDIEGGLPRFQQDREGGASTNYTVDLLDGGSNVVDSRSVALGNDANFTGVATGTYTVQITDQNGCPVSLGTISISNAPYDDFCSAEPVFLGNNGPFTNECATLEVGETGGSCFTGATNQVDQSIWTAFTAPTTSDYVVRIAEGTDATFPATGGFFDSEIAIYTNSATCPALPVLTQLACSDDNTNTSLPSALYSEVPTVAMTAGTTYYIQIDGKAFFTGLNYDGSSQADDIILYIEEFDLLPIELKLFDGVVEDEGNRLFWETAMEKDVEYFSLEASVDGITFFEINRQNPNQKPSNYEFLHTEPQQKMYYRLKDVSTNGEESYSNVVYLVRENTISSEKGLLGVYPNPTLDNVTIRMFYPNSKKVSLQLYDTKGVELINKTIEIPSSQVIEKTLSLSNLPAGVYILTLTTEKGREVVKVVRQ
ncbi:CUB domain-containing protein [Bernardetia sp. OM2101]|uniref:CUB domain-containing protein n=1 Tax=Bernardetia sp. OM2101 TaxID=3344876 RepID=UPI0035CFD758